MPSASFREVKKLHARRRELDGKTRKSVPYNFAGKLVVTVWNGCDPTHEGCQHAIHSQERYCYEALVRRCFDACGNCGICTAVLHTPDGQVLSNFFEFLKYVAEAPKPPHLVCIPKGRSFTQSKLPARLVLQRSGDGCPQLRAVPPHRCLSPMPLPVVPLEHHQKPKGNEQTQQRGYSRPKNAGPFVARPHSVNSLLIGSTTSPALNSKSAPCNREGHATLVVAPEKLLTESMVGTSFTGSLAFSFESPSFRRRPPSCTPPADELSITSPLAKTGVVQPLEQSFQIVPPRAARHTITDIPFPIGIIFNRLGEPIQVDGGAVSTENLCCTDDGELWKIEIVAHGVAHARHVVRSVDPRVANFVQHHRDMLGLSRSPADGGSMGGMDVRSLSFLTDECRDIPVGDLHTTLAFPYLFWMGWLRVGSGSSDVTLQAVEPCSAHETFGTGCSACGATAPGPQLSGGSSPFDGKRYLVV